jgi:hypothetical protein
MEFRQIEIDVDVNRWIESKRTSFAQTHNDILRRQAGLDLNPAASNGPQRLSTPIALNGVGAWSRKGATPPAGTQLRMSYNGKLYTGAIEGGNWVVNGARYVSPSAAAGALTGVSLNGWSYWEAQLPGTAKWQAISKFRTEITKRNKRD